ncbi:hypothetical protein RQN30_05000 [Arcanobacterium hippocoleae]
MNIKAIVSKEKAQSKILRVHIDLAGNNVSEAVLQALAAEADFAYLSQFVNNYADFGSGLRDAENALRR